MSKGNERDQRKERHWRQCMQEWRKGGLSVRVFCRLRGLSEPNFYAWRRELRRRDAMPTAAFAAVQVVRGASVTPSNILEVMLASGRSIRVTSGFDAAALQQLLAVLEGKPC